MSPEFHEKVRRIFDEALELPKAKRARFLEFACADSPVVRKEVARLLEAQEPQNQPGAAEATRGASNRGANDIPSLTRYKIQRELGRGAAGAVYEAVDQVIGRTVALKVLLANSMSDPAETKSLEERLFREASSAGRLAHPGIVTVYDVGKEGDLAYIAMERVDGPTLQKMMREGKMERTKALDILRQAASALDYAHAEGIIHRDIKPANIMLHRGVQAKIADFGIAKVSTMNQLTVAGTILGTPSYMSPEQIQNFPLTGRSDQFSLAVVAFELLTGARPFERDTVAALLMSIVTGQRPPASSTDPTLPKMVDDVLFMAMSREPDARFASCTAFVNALAGAAGGDTGAAVVAPPPPPRMEKPVSLTPPPPPPPPQTVPPAKKSPVGLYIVLGVIAVLLAAAWPVYKYVYPRPVADTAPKNQEAQKDNPIVIAPVETKPGAPAVSLFTSEPEQVQPGATATLRWWVTDAAEVVINHDIGKVAGKGSIEVKPQKDTEYILTATGPGGEATAKVMIAVGKIPPGDKPQPTSIGTTTTDKAPPKPPPLVDSAQAQKLYDEGVAKHRTGSGADAISLFQQAAGLGDPRAMLELGKMYSAGDGVGKDAAEAARWYRKAADLGNASAMVFLGALYAQGVGVPKDLGEAAKWIRKSADAGNANAMDGLGQMYVNGQGVPTDAAQAVTWYRKAIDAGNIAAMYHLGLLLENGSGPVAKNAAEAAQLYQRAAAAGYGPAKAKAAQGGGSLTLSAIDPAGIAVLKSQIYKLTGSGFSANTTVRTDVASSIGSRQGEASNFHPVAVSPDGTWLKIFISVPPPDGRNTVKLIAKNPGGAEVTLDVPIQR